MQAPDPVETILARLMPPALSESSKTDIEEMLGELAAADSEKVVPFSSGKWIARSLIGGGIAAAIGAMCAVFPMVRSAPDAPVAKASVAKPATEFVVISESDRIESVTDEGWRKDSEGADMHSVRLRTVQENNVRDEKSGMVVRISEPREEVLMMPAEFSSEGSVLKKPGSAGMVEAAAVTAEGNGPVRVVNVAEKSASFISPEIGKAVVTREGDIYKLKISGPEAGTVFQGDFTKGDKLEQVPEAWRARIQVLCRTLDQALDGNMIPQREPQPRMEPPTVPKP